MSTVSEREERQLLDAVKAATDLVAGGATPDAAVEKVARDRGLGPGKIRLIGQAYNTGQQLGQWRTPGASILDKTASFPLCDPEAVIETIYNGPSPAEKAAAARVDPAYARPPRFHGEAVKTREKTASVKLPAPAATVYAPSITKAYGNIARAKQAYDATRQKMAHANDRVKAQVAHVVTYFRKQASARLPFHVVDQAAISYLGDGAGILMDMVHQRLPMKEKRAADVAGTKAEVTRGVDINAEPFTLIKGAIDAANEAYKLQKEALALKGAWETAKSEELLPFVSAGSAEQPAATGPWTKDAAAVFGTEKAAFGFGTEVAAIAAGDILAHKATHGVGEDDPYGDVSDLDRELAAIRQQSQQAIGMRRRGMKKQAFMGAGIGAGIGAGLARTLGSVTKTKDDLVDDQWMGLEDPEHENELRKIKAHAMINQLLTDPDDPISGHDPDKVLSAYNEISSAAPRVAENAATLRPALRKRLEGHQEPFESKELLDIEQGLTKNRLQTPNTNILSGNAPGGMFG